VSKKGPEALIQSAIMDYLAARHILAFRMNSGATIMPATDNFKRRFIRYGVKGMADILAFVQREVWITSRTLEAAECSIFERKGYQTTIPLWLEVKASKGKTTADQDNFAAMVREYKHRYIIVRSIEDVEAALATLGG